MSKGKSGRHRQQAIPTARNGALTKKQSGPFAWETLEQFYRELAGVLSIPTSLRPLITNREACALLPDIDAVVDRVNIVARDTEVFHSRLQAIRAKHEGRTGEAADPDEGLLQIVISEEYLAWQAEFDTVVMPNVLYVQQQFESIEVTTAS